MSIDWRIPPYAGPCRGARHAALSAALAMLLVFVPAVAAGQDAGTVTGRVVDAATLRPMVGTQVSLVGAGLGGLTTQDGRYIILNVPAGEYQLRVERIGFGTETRTINVTAGGTVTENFEMETEALGLDEIVVTGTAGAARRREIGNSIGQINVDNIVEPPVNVDALLQGRVSGMTVTPSSGQLGGGSSIRLRGNVSVAMSNQPILYVDGVRVRSDGFARNVPPSGSTLRSNNDIASPLNDINPADIERIEVIKGAAATTLYGTEAAAGVIQIFTKRGFQGAATWNASIEQGVAYMLPFGPDASTAPPSEADVEPFCDENGQDCATPEFLYIDPWLRNAHRQRYTLSVSGGGQALQYFLSGGYEKNEGVLPNDEQDKVVARGNFTFSPMDELQLQWNTSYTNDDLQNTPAGNNAQGITLNTFRRDRNYLQRQSREAIDPLLDWKITTQIDHFITGLTTTWSPSEKLSNRLTVGYDLAQQNNRNLRPFGFGQAPDGILSDGRFEYSALTFDYVGSYNFSLGDELRSSFSWGGQSISTERQETQAYGEDFPGPGEPTVSSAGLTLGFEERLRVINAGFFFQNLLDYKDRYFFTAGLRVDGNSAFGENLGLQTYPKASLSYVISDEDFWPESWGSMKLRAAWGQSGRAPGAFDKIRTFDPVGYGGSPAFLPLRVGNPDIGPERTTEIELGFDAALFGDRLAVDFTFYNQKTSDALFNVRQIPSQGFLVSQLQNVGELRNTGIELAATGTVLRSDAFSWELGGSVYTNDSEILDLGGVPEFTLDDFGWVVEGQPVPVIRARCVENPDELAEPIIREDCDYGPNEPTLTIGGHSTFDLPAGIRLTARGEYQGGHYIYDGAAWNAVRRSVRWPGCFEAYTVQETQGIDAMTAKQRAQCIVQNAQADFFIYPADFFKLRELSLYVPLPDNLVPGTSRASLTVAGRNIWKWVNDDFPVFDPETGNNDGFDAEVRSILEHVPAPAVWTAALRVTF